jgi:hypothetical protein
MQKIENRISHRELARIIIMIILTIVCIGLLWTLGSITEDKDKSNVTKKIPLKVQYAKTKLNRDLPPFTSEDESILKDIEDDTYLTTDHFYYLYHKIASMTPDEVKRKLRPDLNWYNLLQPFERDQIRGEIMRVKGTLVQFQKMVMRGEGAEKRGLEFIEYWRGAIFNAQGHLYLFSIDEIPDDLCLEDDVELIGSFYKVWVYDSQTGREAHNPFIVGKILTIIPPPADNSNFIELPIVIIFLIFFVILVVVMYRDRLKTKEFKKKYNEHRSQRRKILQRTQDEKLVEKNRKLVEDEGENRKAIENEGNDRKAVENEGNDRKTVENEKMKNMSIAIQDKDTFYLEKNKNIETKYKEIDPSVLQEGVDENASTLLLN